MLGIIGPGLLVGSGNALHLAGPAGVLISFALVGVIVFFVMYVHGVTYIHSFWALQPMLYATQPETNPVQAITW